MSHEKRSLKLRLRLELLTYYSIIGSSVWQVLPRGQQL